MKRNDTMYAKKKLYFPYWAAKSLGARVTKCRRMDEFRLLIDAMSMALFLLNLFFHIPYALMPYLLLYGRMSTQ